MVLFRTLENTWFYSKQIEYQNKLQKNKYKYVALDPGMKTFLTYYSKNVGHGYLGNNIMYKMVETCKKIDKLYSKVKSDEINCRKRLRVLKTLTLTGYKLKIIQVLAY